MKKLLVFVCAVTFLLLPLNVQAAPLSGEYVIEVSTTQLGPYSWNFEYKITNINQEAPDDPCTGLDGFEIEIPDTAVISNAVVPVPYPGGKVCGPPPGYWIFSTQGGGLAFFWGMYLESLYPVGQTATFSFQADDVVVGNRDATISTYWGDFQAPGSVQFQNGFWYSSYDTTLVGPAPIPPADAILIFFDESVADDLLKGDGQGNSANGRLNALRNMLEMAGDLINVDDIEGACAQLHAALGKCDGESPPPDFVTGPAAPELADKIEELMDELGCE